MKNKFHVLNACSQNCCGMESYFLTMTLLENSLGIFRRLIFQILKKIASLSTLEIILCKTYCQNYENCNFGMKEYLYKSMGLKVFLLYNHYFCISRSYIFNNTTRCNNTSLIQKFCDSIFRIFSFM